MRLSDRQPTLYTIGFTGRTARSFFEAINNSGVATVLDIRRSNTSQLAGYSKKSDLPYFLEKLCGVQYDHRPDLSPEPDLFRAYRAGDLAWPQFADAFREQLGRTNVVDLLPESTVRDACLLCACHDHQECHRQIVAELLSGRFPGLQTKHL